MAELQWHWHNPNCNRRDCQTTHKFTVPVPASDRWPDGEYEGTSLLDLVGVYRDPAMLGTWDGDTFYSDEQGVQSTWSNYEGEEGSMSEHYDDARRILGAQVNGLLQSLSETKRVWYNEDREGPMGGVSTQISGYMELDNGTIAPFAINIYSDHNIERAMRAKLDEEERQRELRERLDS